MTRKGPHEIPAMKAAMFRPGQSGNPAGRRGRKSFRAIVEAILDEKIQHVIAEATEKGAKPQTIEIERREAVARVLVDELLQRNARLITAFLDRVWPAVTLLGNDPDHPLTLAEIVKLAGEDPEGTKGKRTRRKKAPVRRKKKR